MVGGALADQERPTVMSVGVIEEKLGWSSEHSLLDWIAGVPDSDWSQAVVAMLDRCERDDMERMNDSLNAWRVTLQNQELGDTRPVYQG